MMLFLEVIDECDLECRTCIAGSLAGAGNARDPSELVARVTLYSQRHGRPQLLLLTGGEPALHPNLLSIVKRLEPLVDQIALITNGVRLAEDPEFAIELSKASQNLHVYLQFDSLRPEALLEIRGRDLSEVRRLAIKRLGLAHLATTLVSVIKKGVNDKDIVETVKFAQDKSHVLGVTFQPIRASGRHSSYDRNTHCKLLDEVRTDLIQGLGLSEECIRPHPADPHRVAIGYFCRSNRESLTEVAIPRDAIGAQPLYLPPRVHEFTFGSRSALRVAIVSYYDQYDVTLDDNKPKGIRFLTDDGSSTSLENHFFFNKLLSSDPQPIFIKR